MGLQEEIKESLDTLAKSVADLQTKHTEVEGKVDVIDKDVMAKMTEASAKTIETVNALTAKQTEQETLVKELELALAKGVKTGDVTLEEGAYKDGLVAYMRKNSAIDDGDLESVCRNIVAKSTVGVGDDVVDLMVKDMVAGSNPDGGYFLTTDRSDKISKRIFETSPIRALANVMTTNSDMVEILLDDDEASSGWVGEVQARPDTDSPEVGLIKIPVHELYAKPKATQKMLDDAGFDLEAWLSGKVQRKFTRDENTAFVTGDGAQKPKGFLAYAAWAAAGTYERNAVEQRTGETASVMTGDDLINLQNDLIEDYQAGATWGFKRSTWSNIATLKASTSGAYLLNPRVIAEGAEKILLGSGVSFMNDMPAVADSALAVVYADFQEFYSIVDRFGIRVLRDPYTNKPYVLFYTTKRVGGAVTNYEAGKILKIKAA